MNVREFLNEMLFYFPLKRSRDDLERLFEIYVNDILFTVNQYKDFECDYELLLQLIRCKRDYPNFPPVAEIIKDIPKALKVKPVKPEYSGHEGETIKRTVNGIVYEFTVVPNHWQKVKTQSQVDNWIDKRKKAINA